MESLTSPQDEVQQQLSMIERALRRFGVKRVFVSKVDGSYTGGNPKTDRDNTGTAANEQIPPLMPFGWTNARPGATVLEAELQMGDFALVGQAVNLPSGLLYVGGYIIQPAIPGTAANIGIGSLNQTRIMRVLIPGTIIVASVHFQVTTATNPSNIAVAVYSSEASGQTKLIDTGAVSGATTGVKSTTLGAPVTLTPGWYWLTWTCDDSAVRLAGVSLATNLPGVLNGGTLQLGRGTNSSSDGVMPSSLGTPVDITLTEFPFIKLQS